MNVVVVMGHYSRQPMVAAAKAGFGTAEP